MTAHLPDPAVMEQAARTAAEATQMPSPTQVLAMASRLLGPHAVPLPRQDARRVLSARQLHEAADMASEGTPLPGTNAHAKLTAAMEAGDFATAAKLREAITGFAPEIRAAAIAAENGTRQTQVDATVRAIVDVQTQEQARVKRLRKATARVRAQDAQMRRAARGDG